MDRTSEKLKFKAIHDGVGFHPFSDGLPYSPQTPSKAIRTEAPTFRFPKEQPIKSSSRVALPEPSLIRHRIFAYLLDSTLHLGFWVVVNLFSGVLFGISLDFEFILSHVKGFCAFFAFSHWFFISLQEMLFETTMGKAFFNLEFKKDHRTVFPVVLALRSMVFMLGALLFGIGLIYRPHDHLAELQLKS